MTYQVVERDYEEDVVVRDGKVIAELRYETLGKTIREITSQKHELRRLIEGNNEAT